MRIGITLIILITSFGRLITELSKTPRIIGVELQAHGHSNSSLPIQTWQTFK